MSACLDSSLLLRVLDHVVRSPPRRARASALPSCDRAPRRCRASARARSSSAACSFFTFSVGDLGRTPVRDSGVEDGDVGVLEPVDALVDTSLRPSRRGRCRRRPEPSTDVGPATTVTSAPRRCASRASANPMRPVERFEMNRTGSSGFARRTDRDEDAYTGEVLRRECGDDRFDDVAPARRAVRRRSRRTRDRRSPGATSERAVGRRLRRRCAARRVLPHLGVHRRRDDHRTTAHQIGRRRRCPRRFRSRAGRASRRSRRTTTIRLGPSCELDVDHALGLVRTHRVCTGSR